MDDKSLAKTRQRKAGGIRGRGTIPRVSKTTTTIINQDPSMALTSEALEALRVEAGAELDLEIVGGALVVRSVEEARRSRQFLRILESILTRRRTAYEELAKGPNR